MNEEAPAVRSAAAERRRLLQVDMARLVPHPKPKKWLDILSRSSEALALWERIT